MSGFRLNNGGHIDRERKLRFTFDGQPMTGYEGDSLASALLANGQETVARSFKYHRRRGIYAAGADEPNALVGLRHGARHEPNCRATGVELYDGLMAESQNRWPSLDFDIGAMNGLFSPFFVAGFYYKTFMGPTRHAWMFYEKFIRKAAGMGKASMEPDPDHYDARHAWCDVLVVGAGPAGLAAARSAADAGADVLLADELPVPGGSLLSETTKLDGKTSLEWTRREIATLTKTGRVHYLPRTTVYGYYDDNILGAVERVSDHHPLPQAGQPRHRHWTIKARRVVLATGALERPLVFANNDLPGVMLSGAVRSYANRYAVAAGRRVVIATSNDSGYRTAIDLAHAGVEVACLADARHEPPADLAAEAEGLAIPVRTGSTILAAEGRKAVTGAILTELDAEGRPHGKQESIRTDCLAVSGGWSPVIHLTAQAGGKPQYDAERGQFMPGEALQDWQPAGAIGGADSLSEAWQQGLQAGSAAARDCGLTPSSETSAPEGLDSRKPGSTRLLFQVQGGKGKAFVDLQHDVTARDVRLAHQEGFVSVEHLKRYTTLGMAADQGKTSNINGLAMMASLLDVPLDVAGTTRFRPPYTPVSLGALAGRSTGTHFRPLRRTPLHDWHVEKGAVMVEVGLWQRPRAYPGEGESLIDAIRREARTVRERVGLTDVSTLGKIEIKGPDAPEFLDRVYSNRMGNLKVGRARYGLMLRTDGMVFDDGTLWRLEENRYLMTTTTGNAGGVMKHLEFLLAAVWPELKVHLVSVSDLWSGCAIAGPNSRAVLQTCVSGTELDNDSFRPMDVKAAEIDGAPVWIARLSYSGELAYEVYTPAPHGEAVWKNLLQSGKPQGIVPYGLEALGSLRIEKGHVAGPELDGRTTADDLGLGGLMSKKKHFLGEALARREAMLEADRPQLVGLVSGNGQPIPPGAQLLDSKTVREKEPPLDAQGHVSSPTYGAAIGKYIALALLHDGRARHGESLTASSPLTGENIPVVVVSPHFYDPEGARMNA
ncbi:MAG: sarcosine oxidase subunit alpha family protein [Pseudomonadota bacterium]